MAPNDQPTGSLALRQERPRFPRGCRLGPEPVFKKEIVRQTAEAGTVEIIEYRNRVSYRTRRCDFIVTKEMQYRVWICPTCGECRKHPSQDSPWSLTDMECKSCEERMVQLRVYVVWKKDVKKMEPPLQIPWRDPERELESAYLSPEEAIEKAIQKAGGHAEPEREPEVEWACMGCRNVTPDYRFMVPPIFCSKCRRSMHRIRKALGNCHPFDFARRLLRPLW